MGAETKCSVAPISEMFLSLPVGEQLSGLCGVLTETWWGWEG